MVSYFLGGDLYWKYEAIDEFYFHVISKQRVDKDLFLKVTVIYPEVLLQVSFL